MTQTAAPNKHGRTQSKQAPVPICLPGSSKPIGYVQGSWFRKNIIGSRHMLRSPRAIAFDRSTLVDAAHAGATQVSVTDLDTCKVYIASIETINRYGFTVTRGYGNQVALTLDRWHIDGEQPHTEGQQPSSNQQRKDLQLGLFGGAA